MKKNKINFKITALISLFFIFLTQNSYSQENTLPSPYQPQMIKSFADDLYQNGFWDEAESEYKRYLFIYDNEQIDNECIFKLETIYNENNNLDGSEWIFKTFYNEVSTEIAEKIFIDCTRMSFKKRDKNLFNSFYTLIKPNFSKDIQLLMPISISLLDNNLPLAQELLSQAAQEYTIFTASNDFAKSIKTKNPALALTLSILLPGSGKWYTGSFSSFATSFLTIGGFTAGTIYTGIKYEWKNWRPYVFGSLALIFYISDIYGSYKSAQRYNEAQMRLLSESVDEIYEKIY